MNRPLRQIFIVAVVVLGGGSALAYACYLLAFRGPLEGETFHDFGQVSIASAQPVELQHTFRLMNRLDRPLTIHSIKPDCGCVTVQRGEFSVGARETFEVLVTLALTGVGKRVLIQLDLGDDGITTLKIQAQGEFQPQLVTSSEQILLAPHKPTTFSLVAHIYDGFDVPAKPLITAPPSVAVAFEGWQLSFQSPDLRKLANVWEGVVRVRQVADALAGDESMTVELKPMKPLHIKLFADEPADQETEDHDGKLPSRTRPPDHAIPQ